MPEEKKKDSFTFSDKIKNSKQPGSKSFANRISSKVGSDGKPKRTLFERTKRDAPFIIAALIALLLLPFLYKYSGQVSEEQIVAPSVEDSAFDPERYGFDTVGGDPEGQIAQLAGRDPLSLIKGFGGVEEPESYDSMASFDRSGLEDRSYSDTSEERNTTNIYKRNAPAQTRASFKRAATKIGKLSSAGLTGRGGGKLGVGMWGGGLKSAAKRVKAETPKNSPKPVSLQPLTAAGKPSRSYFGQGAAEQARRSKDAMSKANAMQALADAQFKPIEPGKIGGIAGGDLGGPGGGNGNLERNFAFNGKEPWWWDMMKRRSQMEWEKKFNYKWGWIDWATKLGQVWGEQILNCLVMGNSDGDAGTFWGSPTAAYKDTTCCGVKESRWAAFVQDSTIPFDENNCKGLQKRLQAANPDACPEGWDTPQSAGEVKLGFFGQRMNCLGASFGGGYGTGKPGLTETASGGACADLNSTHNYSVRPEGEALKWNTYHYIVARNYLPKVIQDAVGARANNLCSEFDNNFRKARHSGAGVSTSGEIDYRTEKADDYKELRTKWAASRVHTDDKGKSNNTTLKYSEGSVEPEALADACVIYVAHSTILDWEQQFKPSMVEMFEEVLEGKKVGNVELTKGSDILRQKAVEAFDQLDLMFIESASMKHKIGKTHNLRRVLPMPYWVFAEAYVMRRGMTTKDRNEGGYHTNIDKRKFRLDDEIVHGARCFFDRSVSLSCQNDSKVGDKFFPVATLTFKESYKGAQQQVTDIKKEKIEVHASFSTGGGDSAESYKDQIFHKPTRVEDSNPLTYEYHYTTLSGNKEFGHQNVNGTVKWVLYRNGVAEQTRTCSFNNSADGEPVTEKITPQGCAPGSTLMLPEDATEDADGTCVSISTCTPEGKWGKAVRSTTDPDCIQVQQSNQGQENPVVVSLYTSVETIPTTETILSYENRPGNRGASDDYQKKWQSCKISGGAPLLAVDAETEAYMQAAKSKFEAAPENKDKATLSLGEKANWTVANLVDAMMINPNNGKVPANMVCMLGKTIGANANDPQVGNQGFDNLFGAFLAFIHEDAASFPSKWTRDVNGAKIRDERFRARGDTKPYYWGAYVDNGDRSAYERDVNSGVWKDFPLRELRREPLPKNGAKMGYSDKENRRIFHEELYKDLVRDGACNYSSSQTVTVTNALAYITILCDKGDKQKPKGLGWDIWAKEYPDLATKAAKEENPYHQQRLN